MFDWTEINDMQLELDAFAFGDAVNGSHTMHVSNMVEMTEHWGQGLFGFKTASMFADEGTTANFAGVKAVGFDADFIGDGRSGEEGGLFEKVQLLAHGDHVKAQSATMAEGMFKFGRVSDADLSWKGLTEVAIESDKFDFVLTQEVALED